MGPWQRLKGAYHLLATGHPKSRASLHEAAAKSRRLKNWTGIDADIDSILRASGDDLVRRARQLVAHNPYATNAKYAWSAALTGAGIRPASTLENPTQREQLMAVWRDLGEAADSEEESSPPGRSLAFIERTRKENHLDAFVGNRVLYRRGNRRPAETSAPICTGPAAARRSARRAGGKILAYSRRPTPLNSKSSADNCP